MNQLTLLQNLTPAEIYSQEKVDVILSKITEEAKSVTHDINTVAGRKEIASLAYKIAQSKTFMDECGKKLGEDAKKTLDTINAERKKIRDTLDVLKEQIRQPLTEWEKQDEARKTRLKIGLQTIEKASQDFVRDWQQKSMADFDQALANLVESKNLDWEDYIEDAETIIRIAEERVTTTRGNKKAYDDQQEELRLLRVEKEEREKVEAARIEKEREETRLLTEAEAKKKAEELAKKEESEREQKRLEREKQVALEKEQAIAKEKQDADRRVKEAEEKAQREKDAAVEKERQRAFNEHLAQEEAEKKRQANLKHRAKINNEVLKALAAQGFDDEQGKKIITAIVSGQVPHTKISY